jgi:1,4-alpha-glucan branching enzyme
VLTRIDSMTHGIRVYHPDAADVEIAGSFNGWTPAPMRRAGRGWWEVEIPVGTGMHFLNVRADNGRWTVPPGLQTAADEFNGSVGVLLIP